MRIKRLEAGAAYTGPLPLGCVLCRRGAKMVLLTTGKCRTGCYYCPLSERKKGKEVAFADELLIASDSDMLTEARLIRAQGTGVTGGDPLQDLENTLHRIRVLKRRFGKGHHIHLYTSTIDRDSFLRLQRAGLDELRVHPSLKDWKHLERISLKEAVEGLRMRVGIEVPSLPGNDEALEALIRYADSIRLDFVNLNELEFSETNVKALLKRGMHPKDDVSAAAKGSEELALKMLKLDVSIPLHYCSSSFKDAIQLRRRIMRRARSIARPGDVITPEGTLLKGVVEGAEPEETMRLLIEKHGVPKRLMHIDTEKKRLEVAPWVLEEIHDELPFDSYVVEEYPTADRLEVERTPLKRRKGKGAGAKKRA